MLPSITAIVHNRLNLHPSNAGAAAFQFVQNQAAEKVWQAFQEARSMPQGAGEPFIFARKGNPNFEQFKLLYTGWWMGGWAAMRVQQLCRR